MKTLFGTTALVVAMAMPAFAQDATAPAMTDPSPYLQGVERGVKASDFIGKRVYVTEGDTMGLANTAVAAADANWQDAGEISDLIISMAGDNQAVLVDFGGFLGIGEKTVAVSMSDLTMVPDSSSPDDYFIVFQGTKASLEAAPAYDANMVFTAEEPAATDAAAAPATTMANDATTTATTEPAAADTMAAEPATNDTMAADTTATDSADPAMKTLGTDMAAPAGEGQMVDYATMVEGDLVGKRVYGPNNEDVGEISAVSLDADKKITAAVVDVGGFIGIGEKPVALSADMLTLAPGADGGEPVFRVSMTQEQLEALPTYEK